MENEQNKKQGKNGFIIISVTIIVILLLIGFYFFGYQMGKGLANKIKTTSTTTSTTTVVTTDFDESNNKDAQNLLSLINNYYTILWNKEKISDLTNRDKQMLGIMENGKQKVYENKIITAKQMEDGLNSLFKEKQTINHQDIKGCNDYYEEGDYSCWVYKTKTNTYELGVGSGPRDILPLYQNIVSYVNTNNQYIISIKNLYFVSTEGELHFNQAYVNINDALYNKNSVLSITEKEVPLVFDEETQSYTSDTVQNVKKYLVDNSSKFIGKLSTYTYTFEKVDNNYVLVDYKYTKAN